VGPASDVLLIGGTTFDLVAAGSRPPPLPPYELTSTLTQAEPARQGTISLRLLDVYPLTIRGQVVLHILPNGSGIDPSVQYASGSRAVSFRIPANTTDAVFENESKQIGFQTGTLTGTLLFTPSFATEGDLEITPDSPAVLSVYIPAGPPELTGARVLDATTTSLTLVVNGFASNRSLSRLNIRVELAEGGTGEFTVDVSGITATWFGSPVAEPFGGAFSLTVPFTAPPASSRVRSIEVSVENELGRSNVATALVPAGVTR
jgi:hypothetical protein